mmetsp:Transcript_11395/g.37447  ORF Transcript_11395/g.37447 Transcript_11395/m.37447 type:complete len:358 (-) Transcript_11395:55-1128(-)
MELTEEQKSVEDPSSGGASEEEEETSWQKELLKWFVIAAIIAALVVLSEEVGKLLLGTRSGLSVVPLSWGVVGIIVLSCPRRVILPLFYIFPFSTVSLLYLADKAGWAKAGLIYSCVMAFDVVWFFGIRYYWTGFMKAVAEPADPRGRRVIPKYVHRALRTLDREWAHRIAPMDAEGFASLVLLSVAWATDEQITIYFLAARCELTWPFFASSWFTSVVLRVPETLVRARIIEIVAKNFANLNALARGLNDTPLWLLILFSALALASTLLVHAVHAQLIAEWSTGVDSTPRRKNRARTLDDWLRWCGLLRGGDDSSEGGVSRSSSSSELDAEGQPRPPPRRRRGDQEKKADLASSLL